MTIKHLLTAAAATAFISGAGSALAQTPAPYDPMVPPTDVTAPPTSDAARSQTVPGSMSMPSGPVNPAPAMPMDAHKPMDSSKSVAPASAATKGTDTSAVVATNMITNGPVADTPENRKKYPPLSRAGKRTAPRGD